MDKIRKKNNKIMMVFYMILFVMLLAIVVFAPYLAPFDPFTGNLNESYLTPDRIHLFGTDRLGRDIFSRVLYGVRTSFCIATALILLISSVGIMMGIISAYYGGIIDIIIMRISDILLACPSMVLAIALAGIMGPSVRNAVFAIFIVSISKYIRLTRSLVLKVIHTEYVKAAKLCGTSSFNIMKRHILPNVITPLFISASTDIGTIILEISALSFLGFGIPNHIPELGYMISDGRSNMLYYPWIVLFPGIAIFFIVSTCNLISDALRDRYSS